MSRMQCYEWFKHFKEGRMSFVEDPRPGQYSTSTNDDLIFTEKLKMRRISAKLVPRLLTDDQKENQVEIRNCLPMQMVMKTFLRTS